MPDSEVSNDLDRFVNPYTFVPLPSTVERQEPPPHNVATWRGEDLHCGTIDVTWTLETPMLLPANARTEGWVEADGRVVVPGSTMKGAIRSLHETLFKGCLRVVDTDFLPAYRDSAAAGAADGLQLAVVTATRDGQPLEVAMCTDIVFLDALSLKRAYVSAGTGAPASEEGVAKPTAPVPTVPSSGDVFDLVEVHGDRDDSPLGRVEIDNVTRVEAVSRHRITATDQVQTIEPQVGRRVVHVTDTSARPRSKGPREHRVRARCLWASAVITDRVLPVSDAARRDFSRASDGTRDRQRLTRPGSGGGWRLRTEFDDVKWWGSYAGAAAPWTPVVVGRRAKATGLLHPGDVVWVRTEPAPPDDESSYGEQVAAIALSQLWRHIGAGRLGQRVPEAVHPCRHPYPGPAAEEGREPEPRGPVGLCPSCRVFGSADTDGDDGGRGHQDAYAARVRMGPARSAAPIHLLRVPRLAPLGQPRLGAGMFTLEHREPSADRNPEDRPGQWGASTDDASWRRLRGRKYYWHADPDAQAAHWRNELGRPVTPRYAMRPHQSAEMSRSESQLVPAGTVLAQRIYVDGLTLDELHRVLASVAPQHIADAVPPPDRHPRLAVHLGGGKPFGLGSATATVRTTVMPLSSRYAGVSGSPVTTDRATILRWVSGKQLGTTLNTLYRLLDLNGLGKWRYHVSNPPGAPWDQVGTKTFDEGFRFFDHFNGQRNTLDHRPKPYRPLPSRGQEPALGILDDPGSH